MIPREKLQRVADHLLAARAELAVPALKFHPLQIAVEMCMDLVNMEPMPEDPDPADQGEPTLPLEFPWTTP